MSPASPQRNSPLANDSSTSSPELRLLAPEEALASPSFLSADEKQSTAYELKFLIAEGLALQVQAWAEQQLQPDPFASADLGGAYQTTTLYLDTANFDVLARRPGYKTRKYRLRRYSLEDCLFLERKTRRGDRVGKQRTGLHAAELPKLLARDCTADFPAYWFREEITSRYLQPACRITYLRRAYVAIGSHGALRLTLDRQVRGLPTADWFFDPVEHGHAILPGEVICELKFREALPALFKQLLIDLQLQPSSVSKYRRVMAAAGSAELPK